MTSRFHQAPFIVIGEMTRACDGGPARREDPGCAYEPATEPTVSPRPRTISGGADVVASPATPERVTQALRSVLDPELSLSVVDLGLVYGIAIDGPTVRITMTLTAPGCPLHDVMADWVRRAVLAVPGVQEVEVNLTFDPPWTPARIAAR